MNLEALKNPPKKYRPIPFWSWNEKLEEKETARQIEIMDKAGIGGYFMHARGGLETEYLGEEWFANVDTGVAEGKKRGMGAWAYDEIGWPSGFAAGKVNGLGIEYQQKYLRMEKGEGHTDRTICNLHGYHFYYDVNPFYVDNLDKKVVKEFIRNSYALYEKRYGTEMPGIFTDEPQLSREGIPWSFVLEEEYQKRYSENLLEHLDELYLEVGNFKDTRLKFWKLVTDLFTNAFAKQIYDFCGEHGMQLTGHMLLEETMLSQLTCSGAVMPSYEYFHVPGMDWLSRNKTVPQTPLQVSSVAHQLGKKQVLSETFAMCGHNVSFEELRGLYEGQMVRGVNLLCPHLEGYSLRGIRKRDYPPAMYYQQPWWKEFKKFIDVTSRIGMLLAEGKPDFDTLLIHPQSTAWTLFDNDKNVGLNELQEKFDHAIRTLEEKHVLFDLGDETILSRHAHVEGAAIVVGKQRYTKIVRPIGEVLLDSTKALLDEFEKNGGKLLSQEEVPENPVIDVPEITYTKRSFEDFDMHYFVNSTDQDYRAAFGVRGKMLNDDGELCDFPQVFDFAPLSSVVILDDRTGHAYKQAEQKAKKVLPLEGAWEITSSEPNVLVLDTCDYWFDGELIDENAYILDVGDRANALGKRVSVKLRFKFYAESVCEDLCLVCETPERFEITVNGKQLKQKDAGYFRDAAFRKLPIAALAHVGENEIVLTCDFEQSEEVYEMIRNSRIFETEKNKLYYNMELEALYLTGSFGVKTDGEFTKLDRHAVRYHGGFTLTEMPKETTLQNLEQQGFPFFSGRMTLRKTITLPDCDYRFDAEKRGLNAIGVSVNQTPEKTLIWNPFSLELCDSLTAGENTVTLTLVNNLRNLLGPHHLEEGESISVGPDRFYRRESPFYNPEIGWNDDYCFVETSILEK